MSFNVISSEPCAFNENPANSLFGCGCPSHDDPRIEGDLGEHEGSEGATKKAIFGIIGPNSQKQHVYRRLAQLGPQAAAHGVFTLIISQYKPNGDDISDEITREIDTFRSVALADPKGEFTPVLLHSCVIKRQSQDFQTLMAISDQVKLQQPKNNLTTMVENRHGDLHFLYVTNSGKTLTDYIRRLRAKNNTRPMVTPPDVVDATRKLAEDYQKLAKYQVGHCDMHTSNITYTIEKNKLSLNIIDFGFNNYSRDGQDMNVLHFLFEHAFMGEPRTYETIRPCDPIHYNLFVACFEVMRRCMLVNNDKSIKELLRIVKIIGKDLFVYKHEARGRREKNAIWGDMNSMMGVDRRRYEKYTVELTEEYESYIEYIVWAYGDFFTRQAIQKIWVRVCSKVHDVLLEYYNLHPTLVKDICEPSGSAVNDAYDSYSTGVCVKKYELKIYPVIFDRFCMAFYDKPTGVLDMSFLKKKFDEYSIAFACCSLLTNLVDTFWTCHDEDVRTEIRRIKSDFEAPIFFIRNDDVDQDMFVDMVMDDHIQDPGHFYASTLPLVTYSHASAAPQMPFFPPQQSNSDRIMSPLSFFDDIRHAGLFR